MAQKLSRNKMFHSMAQMVKKRSRECRRHL